MAKSKQIVSKLTEIHGKALVPYVKYGDVLDLVLDEIIYLRDNDVSAIVFDSEPGDPFYGATPDIRKAIIRDMQAHITAIRDDIIKAVRAKLADTLHA